MNVLIGQKPCWKATGPRMPPFLSLCACVLRVDPGSTLRLWSDGSYASWRVLAGWRWRRGELSQPPKAGVVLVAKFRSLDCGYSLPLCNINSDLIQYTFMPPLEVMGPGGSLSMLLSPCLNGEMPAESSPGRWQRWRWHTVATRRWRRSIFGWGWAAVAWQWGLLYCAGF